MRISAIERFAKLLDSIGFVKSAEVIRACHQTGDEGTRVDTTGLAPTVRGLYYYAFYPSVRAKISEAVQASLKYRETESEDHFDNKELLGVNKTASLIIKAFPEQELKIIDAGCNHGQLASSNLLSGRIKRYIGIDRFTTQAKLEAKERFKKAQCKDYRFITNDILLRSTYKNLPKNNNLAVCIGVSGHFRPHQIQRLLLNLNGILSNDNSSRIIFGYPAIKKECFNTLALEHFYEDKINYTVTDDKVLGFKYRVFDPDDMNRFIENCGFEIDRENSCIKDPANTRINYLCLKTIQGK